MTLYIVSLLGSWPQYTPTDLPQTENLWNLNCLSVSGVHLPWAQCCHANMVLLTGMVSESWAVWWGRQGEPITQTHFVALVDSPNVRNNSDRSPLYTWPVTSWMCELVVNVRKNYPDGKVWKGRSFQTLFEQLIRRSFKAFDFSPLLMSCFHTSKLGNSVKIQLKPCLTFSFLTSSTLLKNNC